MAGWAPLFAGPGLRANVRTTMHLATASVSVPLAAVDQLCCCDNYSQCICLLLFLFFFWFFVFFTFFFWGVIALRLVVIVVHLQ